MSTDLTPEQKEIVEKSHSSMRDWTTREERREIYMMVAKASIYRDDEGDLYWKPESTALIANAIYQGMIKFCGEAR